MTGDLPDRPRPAPQRGARRQPRVERSATLGPATPMTPRPNGADAHTASPSSHTSPDPSAPSGRGRVGCARVPGFHPGLSPVAPSGQGAPRRNAAHGDSPATERSGTLRPALLSPVPPFRQVRPSLPPPPAFSGFRRRSGTPRPRAQLLWRRGGCPWTGGRRRSARSSRATRVACLNNLRPVGPASSL